MGMHAIIFLSGQKTEVEAVDPVHGTDVENTNI
jgi:hypothetical protein